MNQNSQETLRAHVDECFKHFVATITALAPKGSRESASFKKPLADFCGVNVSSVTRWFGNTTVLPKGKEYVKLLCFLELVGYRVIELERMPKGRRGFLELVGYSLMSSDDAAQLLGYTSSSSMFQVFAGKYGASADKDHKMWEAWKERRAALEQERVKAKARVEQVMNAGSKRESPASPRTSSRRSAVVLIMEGLLVLLDGDGDTFPDHRLAELRSSTETVLRLSARLSTISSQLITPSEEGKAEDDG